MAVSRDLLAFFHKSNPSGPLVNMLKWFLIKIHFRGDIREISNSAQANTARSFAGTNFFFAGSPYLDSENLIIFLNI